MGSLSRFSPYAKQLNGHATYFVADTIHSKTQRCLTISRTKKEGVYAISMGIIHGNNFKHGLRVCHFVASNNLGLTTIWVCGIGESRISDHLYFYSNLDPAFLSVAADFQLDCFKALTTCLWRLDNIKGTNN